MSFAALAAGVTAAYASRTYPERRLLLERCGGILLVAGLIMIGFAFPFWN